MRAESDRHQPDAASLGGERVPSLAIFTSHPIQYQAPLFKELTRQGRVRPLVFFGSTTGLDGAFDPHYGAVLKWDTPVLEGYEHVFLENVSSVPAVGTFRGLKVRDIRAEWGTRRFDAALVLGWNTRAHLQASAAAVALGIPLFIRGESSLTMRPPSSTKAWLRRQLWLPARRRLYSRLFRRATGFFVIGSRNADFYRHHGVADDRLWWAPYGVDNDHFALPGAQHRAARARVRGQLGVRDATVLFVSAAKLLPRKRPFDLLRAFAALGSDVDAHLLYLGGGPERSALEAEAARLGVASRISISGFVNQSLMPDWYAAGDCLVLPSDHMETWGLVVNEAMAAGLPAIVSDAVGCGPDLVVDGVSGTRFPLGDVSVLAQQLRAMVSMGDAARRGLGEGARQLVSGFSMPLNAQTIADAVIAATAPFQQRADVLAVAERSRYGPRLSTRGGER